MMLDAQRACWCRAARWLLRATRAICARSAPWCFALFDDMPFYAYDTMPLWCRFYDICLMRAMPLLFADWWCHAAMARRWCRAPPRCVILLMLRALPPLLRFWCCYAMLIPPRDMRAYDAMPLMRCCLMMLRCYAERDAMRAMPRVTPYAADDIATLRRRALLSRYDSARYAMRHALCADALRDARCALCFVIVIIFITIFLRRCHYSGFFSFLHCHYFLRHYHFSSCFSSLRRFRFRYFSPFLLSLFAISSH